MTRNPSEVEQAVSRTLRDSLAKLQQTSGELNQAVNDLVSACASARPSNSLPPMLRARSAAASLAASLEVLSKFVITSLQSVSVPAEEEELLAAAPRMAAPAAPVERVEPVAPIAPVAPAAPVEVIEAVVPIAPVAPAAPVEVIEAVAPIAPVAPTAPVEVIEAVAPIAPVAPTAPVEVIEPVVPIAPAAPAAPEEHLEAVEPVERVEVETAEPALPAEPPLAAPPAAELPLAEVAPPPTESKALEPAPEAEWAQLLEPVPPAAEEELTPVGTLSSDSSSAPLPASYNEVLPPEAVGFDVLALAPEEQELHRRANRVAKVSMQDVKMLRPVDVALGREHKDLCIRLRDDIEKAHREYDRRFHAIMDHPVDYFYDWMVEILGGGDPQTLGEYPYPTPVLRR